MTHLVKRIYCNGDILPQKLCKDNFFHSLELFQLCKATPRIDPYIITVETTDGKIEAQMLALVRRRTSWMPPYLYRHCLVLGEGIFNTQQPKDQLFGMMVDQLKNNVGRKALFIELSNISQKMFGYKQLKANDFFPVRWMSIHNSLHSKPAEERLTAKHLKLIKKAYDKGVVTNEVKTVADFKAFMKLLKRHNWLKPKRYIPADEFFLGLQQAGAAKLFVTRYHEHIIGCSAVIYSQRQAYLWYAAYRRKSFAALHPDELTIWHAIKDAQQGGFEHINFMDVGLPYSHNKFREFILNFGGKPVSTYRWFFCNIKWVNKILKWIYRD